MEPIVLFGIQFSLSLVAYALIAFWYVVPRLSRLPREVALVPLLWIHPRPRYWQLIASCGKRFGWPPLLLAASKPPTP